MPCLARTKRWAVRLLFNLGSFWVGVHWSKACRRWCINLVPCVTICVIKPHGVIPAGKCAGDK